MSSNNVIQRGFSLLEIVIVLMIVGILVGILSIVFSFPLQQYQATAVRQQFTDDAAIAWQLLRKELHKAIIGSVRVSSFSPTSISAVEFMPHFAEGYYRAGATADKPAPALDLTVNQGRFELFPRLQSVKYLNTGNGSQACLTQQASCLLIPEVAPSAYSFYAVKQQQIATVSEYADGILAFDNSDLPNWHFIGNPSTKFYLTNSPVSYVCDVATGTLKRYVNYGIRPIQPLNFSEHSGQIFIKQVVYCDFRYTRHGNKHVLGLLVGLKNPVTDASVVLYERIFF